MARPATDRAPIDVDRAFFSKFLEEGDKNLELPLLILGVQLPPSRSDLALHALHGVDGVLHLVNQPAL
ncbi:MAG TPA: hypothetical protein VES67_19925, partial [Vicinamibacterales bacterium]|nr:hypothetical protein [Vicinamibacterales bacterium]